jgi:inosose dehydratase
MKIGSMLITWGETPDFNNIFAGLSAHGYSGVEFFQSRSSLGNTQRLVDLLQTYSLSAVSLLCEGDMLCKNASDSAENRKRIETAAALGVEVIDFVGGWINSSGEKTAGNIRTFAEILTDLASYAGSFGMKSALHNHMGSLAENLKDIERIFNEGSGFGLCLDTAHCKLAGNDPSRVLDRMKDKVNYIHLKDYKQEPDEKAGDWFPERFCELGEGNIGLDFPDFFQKAGELNFNGWMTVELDRPQKDRTPLTSASISREFIRSLR